LEQVEAAHAIELARLGMRSAMTEIITPEERVRTCAKDGRMLHSFIEDDEVRHILHDIPIL
jgi:hypothetical protein